MYKPSTESRICQCFVYSLHNFFFEKLFLSLLLLRRQKNSLPTKSEKEKGAKVAGVQSSHRLCSFS
jgi:hypothetical protein